MKFGWVSCTHTHTHIYIYIEFKLLGERRYDILQYKIASYWFILPNSDRPPGPESISRIARVFYLRPLARICIVYIAQTGPRVSQDVQILCHSLISYQQKSLSWIWECIWTGLRIVIWHIVVGRYIFQKQFWLSSVGTKLVTFESKYNIVKQTVELWSVDIPWRSSDVIIILYWF